MRCKHCKEEIEEVKRAGRTLWLHKDTWFHTCALTAEPFQLPKPTRQERAK